MVDNAPERYSSQRLGVFEVPTFYNCECLYYIAGANFVAYNFSMPRSIIRIAILLSALIFISTSAAVHAQSGTGEIYIPETGHWIRGSYLEMYQSADDPILVFGYPITDEIVDPIDGQHTQYFEKARFDLVETGTESVIELAALGDLMLPLETEPVDIGGNAQACRKFAATGESVCYAFLDFYEAHDGEEFFGDPISPVVSMDGRYVQYFENVRMEWRPELPAGSRVALTDLGSRYFDSRLGDYMALETAGTSDAPDELVQLQVHAFVANSLQPANSHQEVFVTVQDQNLNPINGANINVRILWPDGQVDVFRPAVSNENGISTLKFEVGDLDVNEVVQVEVQASYRGFSADGSTWFRIWW